MRVICPDCDRCYDDAMRWTQCPHRRLDEPCNPFPRSPAMPKNESGVPTLPDQAKTATEAMKGSKHFIWTGETVDATSAKPCTVKGVGKRPGTVEISVDEPDGWIGDVPASALYPTAEACTAANERLQQTPDMSLPDAYQKIKSIEDYLATSHPSNDGTRITKLKQAISILAGIAKGHGQMSEEQAAAVAELLN